MRRTEVFESTVVLPLRDGTTSLHGKAPSLPRTPGHFQRGSHHSRGVGCLGVLAAWVSEIHPYPNPWPWGITAYDELLLGAGAISHTSPSLQTRNSGSEKLWPRSHDRPCPGELRGAGGGDNSQGAMLPRAQVAR